MEMGSWGGRLGVKVEMGTGGGGGLRVNLKMETWEGWAWSRGGDGDWENGLGVKVEMGTGGR